MRRLARIEHIDAVICCDRPVVVLTGTIDTCERFLVEKAFESVLACNPLQGLHYNLVVVYRNVRLCVDRSQLVLCRSYLVVLCLCGDSDFPQLLVDIFHKCGDPLADRSKVVIVKLLAFRRHCSEECTSCINQVFPLLELLRIYKEILLLRTYGRSHFPGCCIAKQS